MPLLQGDPMLLNVYSVIPVSGALREAAAREFTDWLVSDEGRRRIAAFGQNEQRAMFQPITPKHPSPVTLQMLEDALVGASATADGGAGR